MQNCGKEALITMFKDSSLPFGIIRVELDETGRPADWIFLCCNQALETLTGRTRAELLSNSFLTLRPDGASEWMGPFYTAAFEKSPARLEVRDETRKFHLYIDCLPIDEAGECALLLRNSWKEDTYRKKLEEQIVSFRNIHKSMSSGAWHLTFNDRWERVSVEWSDTLRQMLGFRSDAAALLNILDVQLNASYGTEATSMALLEGMSLGLPTIASDYGGNPFVITSGQNGLLFPSKDSAALADAMAELMDHPEEVSIMREKALETYQSRVTGEVFARNTEHIYENVLKGASK